MSDTLAGEPTVADLTAELARLRDEVADARRLAQRAEDRGQVENLFNRYMYLHNAFQDEQIIPLWVKEGTEGIRARYTNAGQYTTWESVTRYHRGRPSPEGKLILHSLQVNIQGGRLPEQEGNGKRYLKIPLDALEPAPWAD